MMSSGQGLQQQNAGAYSLASPKKTGMQPLGMPMAGGFQSGGDGPSGGMSNGMGGNTGFSNTGGIQMAPGSRPTTGGGAGAGSGFGGTTFGAEKNLINQQFTPQNSGATNQAQNWTTQSGAQYNGFQLSPFQSQGPLNYGTERGMLNGANGAMQGLGYDFGGANGMYGTAQTQLAQAGQGAQGFMGQAAQMASGGLSGGNGYSQSADVARARELTMKGLEGAQGPDRAKLAAENLALLEERSRPGYEQSLRSVNQKSAAMGRSGSGVTTNELGDVTLARERELALARRDSANDAAGRTLDDRLAVLGASQGVAQGFGSMDQSGASINDAAARAGSANALQAAGLMRGLGQDAYSMGSDRANLSMGIGDRFGDQARDRTGLGERQAGFTRGIANDLGGMTRDTYEAGTRERDTARQDEYNQGDFLGNRFDRNAGYLGQREGQDRANRNEMRDERGYQYGLSRDAVGDEMDRADFEERIRNGRYNRGLGYANLGFGADSPAGAYDTAAGNAGQRSADGYGLLGAGMSFAGQSRRRSGAGAGG